MAQIENELQYKATMERIEELLLVVEEDSPRYGKETIELELLSNLVADYDEIHYPIAKPSLVDVIKLRMYEMNLTQKSLAELLEVSQSRISELLTEKIEPSLSLARKLCTKLSIDPATVLGV